MEIPTKGVINFYGASGTGKTTYFDKNVKHVKFDHDILKSKDRTIDFLNRMRYSKLAIVLDDYELADGLVGLKEIKQLKVPIYVISLNKIQASPFSITDYYEHQPNFSEFAASLGLQVKDVLEKIKNGNMNTVKMDTVFFSSSRDDVLSPKMYVQDLLNGKTQDGLSRIMVEHCHTFGLMHENYVDYVSSCETAAQVLDSFSRADQIDNAIYSDVSWDLIQFFNINACLIPACLLKETSGSCSTTGSCPTPLRPGSIWTKYSNACMKANRLKRLKIHQDCIQLIVLYLNTNSSIELPFDSYDLDSINQLSISKKIIPKILTKLKATMKIVDSLKK
jgi:hypothetical protein